jgi:NAD(P)H-hydrate epimerase
MADPLERPLPYALLPRLATADDMRRMDRHAIDELNLPARLLMENAAHAVADRVCELAAVAAGDSPVVVLCGPGNNGADGLAAARLIKNRGNPTTVIQAGKVTSLDGNANFQAWRQFGEIYDAVRESAAAEALLEQAGVVVDALFGVGLARPVEGLYRDWIDRFNACPAPYKVAVDIPSGVDTDTGQVLGIAAQCTHTVTFQLGKIGLTQWPGAGLAGQVEVADISIPVHWEPNLPATYLLNEAFARALLPCRPADGHKGTFGHLLSVCGSAGMGGAALLAGLAALKSGAGLVTCGVPLSLRDRFLAFAPELMTLASEQDPATHFAPEHVPLLLAAARERTAAVLGCGLGRSDATAAFARRFALELERPLLIDADGLYPFSGADLRARPAATVITPHPGELARLSGVDAGEIGRDRVGYARRFAADWNVVLVLKGAGTVIADPSGEVFVHPVADHAFASGGSGDVLSGIIGGLMAQGLPPLRATLLGVWLHGAARTAQAELAGAFFTASDLIAGLNGALRGLGAD